MNRRALLLAMVQAGMIQFGHFTPAYGQSAAPVRFQFTLLPSFPHLMASVADKFLALLGDVAPNTRLLATQNMIGVGSLMAVQTGIPLLYSIPNGQTLKIEGTADVSNPIVLITDVLWGHNADQLLWRESVRIGLPIESAISLLDVVGGANNMANFRRGALYQFDELLQWLYTESLITAPLHDHLQHWHDNL